MSQTSTSTSTTTSVTSVIPVDKNKTSTAIPKATTITAFQSTTGDSIKKHMK